MLCPRGVQKDANLRARKNIFNVNIWNRITYSNRSFTVGKRPNYGKSISVRMKYLYAHPISINKVTACVYTLSKRKDSDRAEYESSLVSNFFI